MINMGYQQLPPGEEICDRHRQRLQRESNGDCCAWPGCEAKKFRNVTVEVRAKLLSVHPDIAVHETSKICDSHRRQLVRTHAQQATSATQTQVGSIGESVLPAHSSLVQLGISVLTPGVTKPLVDLEKEAFSNLLDRVQTQSPGPTIKGGPSNASSFRFGGHTYIPITEPRVDSTAASESTLKNRTNYLKDVVKVTSVSNRSDTSEQQAAVDAQYQALLKSDKQYFRNLMLSSGIIKKQFSMDAGQTLALATVGSCYL